MSLRASRTIAKFCRNKAGESLRGVYHYSDGEYEALYLRDDIAEQYTDEGLTDFFELVAESEDTDTQQEEALHVGTHHATLRLYDDALLLQFPQGEDIGTLIALDPTAGRDISAFVVQCLETLHQTSEQDVQNAPVWDFL